jgi:hypothetical protein
MDAATKNWVDSVTGSQLADMAVNNPQLFGKYMKAVDPEYRRLRAFARRKSQRVGDLNVQRVEHLKRATRCTIAR